MKADESIFSKSDFSNITPFAMQLSKFALHNHIVGELKKAPSAANVDLRRPRSESCGVIFEAVVTFQKSHTVQCNRTNFHQP